MDAVKFVKEYLRMCAKASCCEECPAFMTDFCTVNVELQSPESAEQIAALVEEWSAAHPRKTRQSAFLEHWPDATLDRHGVSVLCPKQLNCEFSCIDENDTETPKRCKDCTACRREFWMQEVE